MNDLDFRKWPKTPRFLNSEMIITQKMNGTNAQILFDDYCRTSMIGSRKRWLCDEEDNFGFYAWVMDNKSSLRTVLGYGRHYGEWCGLGIQNGEGLSERKFFSFNPFLEVPDEYKHLIEPVPLLYKGPINTKDVRIILQNLHRDGSRINTDVDAEGIIINIGGKRFKMYLSDLGEL